MCRYDDIHRIYITKPLSSLALYFVTMSKLFLDNIRGKDHCQTDKFTSRDGRTSWGGRAGLLYLPRRIQISPSKGLLVFVITSRKDRCFDQASAAFFPWLRHRHPCISYCTVEFVVLYILSSLSQHFTLSSSVLKLFLGTFSCGLLMVFG